MKFFIKIAASVAICMSTLLYSVGCNDLFVSGENPTSGVVGEKESVSVDTSGDGFYNKFGKIDVNININEAVSTPTQLTEMLESARRSVVEIYAQTQDGTGAGSGVIVSITDSDKNGTDDTAVIVTCHHVIAGAYQTTVKTLDGTEYSANLIGSDPSSDIGVISIFAEEDKDFDNLTFASWYSNSDNIKVGTEVVAIGNPRGVLGGTVTRGIISSLDRNIEVEGRTMTLLQTDAAINGGNSGGGLFDVSTGSLLGIVNAGYEPYAAEGLSFAIPSNTAMDIETKLLSTYGETFGYIEGAYDLGVEFDTPFDIYNRKYYVRISALDSYGTFYKGGMQVGDLIYSIKIGENTFEILSVTTETLTGLELFLKDNVKVGDKVEISYGRMSGNNYKTYTANFEIMQYIYGNS